MAENCSTCKEPLSSGNASLSNLRRNSGRCRVCLKTTSFVNYSKIKNLPEYKEKQRQHQIKSRMARPAASILIRARQNAKSRGLKCTLELKDIPAIPEYCPVFPWIKLEYTVGKGRAVYSAPSLDRIDNSVGYVPGNVRIISWGANQLKGKANDRELVALGEDASKPIHERLNFETNDETLSELAFGTVNIILERLLEPISKIEIVKPVISFSSLIRRKETVASKKVVFKKLKPFKFKLIKKKRYRPISNIRNIKLIWDKENQRWLEQAA